MENKCVTVPSIWVKRLQKDNFGNSVIRNKGRKANAQPKLGDAEGRKEGNRLEPETPASPWGSSPHPLWHKRPEQSVRLVGLKEAHCSGLPAQIFSQIGRFLTNCFSYVLLRLRHSGKDWKLTMQWPGLKQTKKKESRKFLGVHNLISKLL